MFLRADLVQLLWPTRTLGIMCGPLAVYYFSTQGTSRRGSVSFTFARGFPSKMPIVTQSLDVTRASPRPCSDSPKLIDVPTLVLPVRASPPSPSRIVIRFSTKTSGRHLLFVCFLDLGVPVVDEW